MSGRAQLFQAAVLIVVVLIFDISERLKPRNEVNRRRDLSLNIFALLVVIFAGEAWKTIIRDELDALTLSGNSLVAALRELPGYVKICLGLTVADFCLYWVHRAMHRRLLWPTHTFHHSLNELWWLSGSRTSVTHLFLFALPQVFLADYALRLSAQEAGIAFSVGIIVNVWIHANISVNLGRLGWLFITPDYHRIHHGARGLSNNNLGFVFTLWDRMFGTYVDPKSVSKDFPLGAISIRKGLLRMIAGF